VCYYIGRGIGQRKLVRMSACYSANHIDQRVRKNFTHVWFELFPPGNVDRHEGRIESTLLSALIIKVTLMRLYWYLKILTLQAEVLYPEAVWHINVSVCQYKLIGQLFGLLAEGFIFAFV